MSQLLNNLIQARAIIAHGWCQETAAQRLSDRSPLSFFEDPSPKNIGNYAFCARGAMFVAAQTGDADSYLSRISDMDVALARVIRYIAHADFNYRRFGTDTASVVIQYNNAQGRTQTEMLALFDAAIDTERAKVSPQLPDSITACLDVPAEDLADA